jgi:FtsH-binding integral membrane protein
MNARADHLSSEAADRATGRSRVISALAPFLILAIFAAGFASFIGWPTWPVTDAGERIAYSAIAAAVFAIVASVVSCCWIRLVLNLFAAIVCVLPAMWPQYENEFWSAGQLALWATLVIVGIAIAASLTQQLRHRDRSPLASLITLGMALSGGGLLMATGSLKLGQAGFALASGVIVVFIIGLFVKSIGRSAGATTLAIAVLGGLLVSGYLWSELPWYSGVCVLLAPLLAWVVRIPILARRPLWQRVVIGLVIAAIPATVVTTIAAVKAQQASEAADDYGY